MSNTFSSVVSLSPKLDKKLPDTLNIDDIENILKSIDLNSFEGVRNRAIIETLYSCGSVSYTHLTLPTKA